MTNFSCADELIGHLRAENQKGERYATRFILVSGRNAWEDVVSRLTREVSEVVCLSDFCSGPDVLPDMTKVQAHLKGSDHRSILLVPLAECMRLAPDVGEVVRILAEWPSGSVRRLYVPLLAVEELLLAEVRQIPRFLQGLLPDFCRLRGEGSVEIAVAPFPAKAVERPVIEGTREYLRRWEKGSIGAAWIVSNLAPYLSRQQASSEFVVRIYPSSFDYVTQSAGCGELRVDWGSAGKWDWLARQIQAGESLDGAAQRILGVADYSEQRLLTLWLTLDENQRWLAWLWSKLRAKPGTYLRHVLDGSRELGDFDHNAAMTVFPMPRSPAFSRERKELLRCLGTSLMPPGFWNHYRGLANPLDQIAVLTDLSREEREELVLCVGRLLSESSPDLWWEYLEVAFPEIAWYLQPVPTGDEFADTYFRVYNRCRLQDRADEELVAQVARWAEQQLLWDYPTRSDFIAEQRVRGSAVLWVDAMGGEWTGLLTHLLARDGGIECEVKAVRANLPSVTEVNKEWESGEEVIRGLDDIAHHYDYRFPRSYLDAVEVIETVAQRVLALLGERPAAVITADHGLSRFAVTSGMKLEPPPGAEVEARGRYAVVEDHGSDSSNVWVTEQGAIYLLTHHRFVGAGGPSRGEVHSGATPEECLVPAIVVRRAGAEPPLQLVLLTEILKLNARGEGVLRVRFSRNLASVELRMGGRALPGKAAPGLEWSFSLKDLRAGEYMAKLYSSSKLVGGVEFKVERGMVEDDLGLEGDPRT
ncbi:MAG TPA: BREX-4 system phosphatase PglZ [Bacillota bacterium]|nr:BREX-4 system phosphatase PglZ [Bacillota bacterium]